MRPRTHRTSLLFLTLSVWLNSALPSPAGAQHQALLPQPKRSASPGSIAHRAEAKRHFERGLSLFNANNASGALAEFQQAYSHVPNPLVLFNIGLTYASMGLPVQATDSLKGVLRNPGALRPSVLNRAQEVLFEQEKHIGTVAFTANTHATLVVDGRPAGTTPLAAALPLCAGPHRVTASAPGHAPLQLDVTIVGGEKRAIRLTLEAQTGTVTADTTRSDPSHPGPTVNSTEARPGISGQQDSQEDRPARPAKLPSLGVGTSSYSPATFEEHSSAKVTGWVILGGGIAVLAAGGIVTAVTDDDTDLRLAGQIGIGVGAAGVIGGALIILLTKNGSNLAQLNSPTHFNAQLGPGGGALFVTRSF